MEGDMSPDNAWRVGLAADGRIRWVASGEALYRQPARSFRQRIEDIVFMVFPRDLY
jgi:hypothetical protein